VNSPCQSLTGGKRGHQISAIISALTKISEQLEYATISTSNISA
jgi:hypothetical protein